MLVLTRKVGEEIIIDSAIRVTVLGLRGDKVKLGVEAPPDVRVDRAEVHARRFEVEIDLVDNQLAEDPQFAPAVR